MKVKPRQFIGFTAFSESLDTAKNTFESLLWTIIQYDETSSGWERQFENLIVYLKQIESNPLKLEYLIDVCIITAVAIEQQAVINLPWDWSAPEPIDESTFIRKGSFISNSFIINVICACAPRMGSVASALLASKLINKYRPRFIVMAGICAGVRDKVNLGDPVLFEPCWEWASGKLVNDEFGESHLEAAPHQISTSEYIVSRFEELRIQKEKWLKIQSDWNVQSQNLLKLVIGPGASGPSVIANGTGSIKQQHRKLTAVEMEAYGVYAAAASASLPRPTAFAIKSVCDFGDEEKNDSFQSYSAYTSAKTIQLFFETYYSNIKEFAGT